MVSIIVPVCNVEQYIDRCIESLRNQTLEEIEIILVDDGSVDASASKCDAHAAKDARITVIHQENQGPSGARNQGLACAKGDWLLFVDGDDYVEPQFVECLYQEVLSSGSDIAICNYVCRTEDGKRMERGCVSEVGQMAPFDSVDALLFFENRKYGMFFDVVWNKIFRKTLFANLSFPEGVALVEDICILPQLFHRAKKVSVIGEKLYNYVYRKGSLSHGFYQKEEAYRLRKAMMEQRLEYYQCWGIKELVLLHYIHMYSLIAGYSKGTDKRLEEIQKEFRKCYLTGKYQKPLSVTRKMKFMMGAISLKLYDGMASCLPRCKKRSGMENAMKNEYYEVLELTRAAVSGAGAAILEETDWDEVSQLLKRGRLYSIVYRTAVGMAERLPVSEKQLSEWKSYAFYEGFCQLQMVNELKKVLQEAELRKIPVVVFKGVTLAVLYPEPYLRASNDVDLLLEETERRKMEQLLLELGYEKMEQMSKEHVPVYKINEKNRLLKIELHDCLWEDYEGKQADILREMHLDDPQTFLQQKVFGFTVATLGYTEHLIYQVFHMAKHFFFEGIELRYLVDLMLYLDTYADKIDFERVNREISRLHYERFYHIILKICRDYLGMRTRVSYRDAEKKLVEQLLTDIMETGKQKDKVKRWETINFLEQYFMRTSVTKVSDFQQCRKQIFPMPSELNEKYAYAKKYPFFLPFAWLHRVGYLISYSGHCRKNNGKASESMEKARYRLNLMRKLDITETERENQEN